MKIILIVAVPTLGKVGDIVEVKSGYAKNFLIPSKFAICFTSYNYKVFEAKKSEFEKINLGNFNIAEEIKAQISGKELLISENAADDGRLYGSVNSATIASKINEVIGKKAVSRANVFLKKPIKEIGTYEVTLNFHAENTFSITVVVARNATVVSGNK